MKELGDWARGAAGDLLEGAGRVVVLAVEDRPLARDAQLSLRRSPAAAQPRSAAAIGVRAVSTEHLQVHDLDQNCPDGTEGTPAGVGINWERCRYDWSHSGSVKATVTDSNVYQPANSSWELRAAPSENGSKVG
jgi:hypothetical protein